MDKIVKQRRRTVPANMPDNSGVPRFTFAEAARLVEMLLNAVQVGGVVEDRTYSLEEVAARCHIALSTLVKDCCAGRIKHVNKGNARSMTPTQVAKMLAQYSRGGELGYRIPGQETPEEQAVRMSRKTAARAPRRRS